MSYLDKTIVEIHEAYVKGLITPYEIVKEAIERAKTSSDNALEATCFDEALAFAKNLTSVEKDNYLWGIPYFAKDNFSTKGIETTASSNILNGYVPVFDAEVIKRLTEKKAILLGKTTLDELAMGGTGTTGHKGKTYNPYDKSHTHLIGGSSAGSAAVVASNIVPFALGSDTGDSVRKPASYGGLVGVKPTWGRISRLGLFPFAPSLDTVGFFTRSVEDSSIILNALAGHDEKDSTSSHKEVDNYYQDIKTIIKNKKVAVIKEILDKSDETIKKSFSDLVQNLKSKGFEVEEVSIDESYLDAILPAYLIISCAEATSCNANLDGIKFGPYVEGCKTYEELMNKARTQGFSDLIKRRFVIGSFSLMKDNQEIFFSKAKKARNAITRVYKQLFDKYAFVMVPASPTTAPTFSSLNEIKEKTNCFEENHLGIQNFAGLPSITLPLGIKEGLPFGVNLTSNLFEEKELYKFAYQVEGSLNLKNMSARKEEN